MKYFTITIFFFCILFWASNRGGSLGQGLGDDPWDGTLIIMGGTRRTCQRCPRTSDCLSRYGTPDSDSFTTSTGPGSRDVSRGTGPVS